MDGRLENEEEGMRLFEKCPLCGGEVVEKEVEKLLKGDGNTAVVRVEAEVCLHCGERLYAPDVIARFEDIRKRLKEGKTEKFIEIGKSYQAA
jgi:YgiT-type zinc finger domain-containing protein